MDWHAVTFSIYRAKTAGGATAAPASSMGRSASPARRTCTPLERKSSPSNPSGKWRGSGISRSTVFGLLPGTTVRLELPPRERVEPRLRASRQGSRGTLGSRAVSSAPSGRGSWARPPSRFLTVSSPKSPKKKGNSSPLHALIDKDKTTQTNLVATSTALAASGANPCAPISFA